MNHYPRHIGDIVSATVGLSLMERGAYTALIDMYYLHEKALPTDRKEVYRLAMCTSAQERKAVDYVITRFFTDGPDGWHQKRCDEELAKYREKSAKAAQSASVRWADGHANAMRTHSDGNANASETHGKRNASQEPVANSHRKATQGREQREPRPARARGSRLPSEWSLPDDWGRWAMAKRSWSKAQAERVAEEFRDYWLSRGETRADWFATWRTWVSRERNTGGRQSERERIGAAIYGSTEESTHERVIDGEAKRVA